MTTKNTFPEVMWAGTQHSLTLAMEAHDRIMAGIFDKEDDEEEKDPPNCFSMQGNIGVISIKGPLTNKDTWYNSYLGVTSYGDIRAGMMYAAQNAEVKAILLDIDSGGGAVSGVADASNIISLVDKNIKPVYAFTDGSMCSAAYWLGCTAREVYSSNTSTVGSIGVIATHMEYSKQLKDEGVGVNVVRAGKYKALLNSVEPASAAALTQLQKQLDAAYEVFLNHVADSRGVTVTACDEVMAQGREFFGKEALSAGLVDGIETFDSVVSKISLKVLDNEKLSQNNSLNYQRGTDMGKKALTDNDIAALAAGVELDAAVEEAVVVEGAASPEEVVADAAPVEQAAEVTETQNENNNASVLSFFQAQVKEKDSEILNLSIELKGIKDKVASMEATHVGLTDVVRKAVAGMKVRLGASNVDLSALSAESLLAEYKTTAEAFVQTYKAGGVAAVDAASSESNQPQVDPRHLARVNAARFVKQGAKHG